MKGLIILAVISVATSVPVDKNRRTRSIGHHDYYDNNSYGAAYQPYPIATYDTVKIGHPVDIPIKTEIHTTSVQRHDVHVPVTYTYTVEQPVHKTSTIYHHNSAPSYHVPSYHAAPSYHVPSYHTAQVYHQPTTVYQTPTVYSAPSYAESSSWNNVAVDPWC